MGNVFLDAANGRSHQSIINRVKQMAGGNPQMLYNKMLQNNPQFAQFIHDNQGKTPEQIAKEHGIDYNSLRKFI